MNLLCLYFVAVGMTQKVTSPVCCDVSCLQGYTRLLKVLGSNLAEFLQNLNDLHLHLQYCWPAMLAPAFRCEEVSSACGVA